MMLLDQIILRDIDGTQNLVQQYCRKTSEAGQFNNNNDKSNYYCGYKINKYGNKQLFSVRGFVLFANISIYIIITSAFIMLSILSTKSIHYFSL